MEIKYVKKKENICANKYTSFILPWLTIGIDYIAIVSALYVAYMLRKYVIPPIVPDFHINTIYFMLIVPGLFLIFLQGSKTYMRNTPFFIQAKKILLATIYSVITATFLMYFGKVSDGVSRIFVVLSGMLSLIFILTARYTIEQFLRKAKILRIPLLIIGAGKTAEILLDSLRNDSGFSYNIIGFIDDSPISKTISQEYKILGNFSDMVKIVKETKVQSLLICAPGLSSEKLINLIHLVQPYVKNISFVPDLIGTPIGSIEATSFMDERIMVLTVTNNLARKYNRAFKRAFDLLLCILGLPFFLTIGLIVSGLIYMDCPGPVFFAHRRVGKNGIEFPCYKFRTMVVNASDYLEEYLANNPDARVEWAREFKLKNDPRITKIGKFLRKTSLDELPQLFNVIKGEMSLVGPRPIVQEEIEKYGVYIRDFYLVPPGITGIWQVSGRSDTTYEERVQMDSWYVRNWSIWMDIIYLCRTAKAVLTKKGAY